MIQTVVLLLFSAHHVLVVRSSVTAVVCTYLLVLHSTAAVFGTHVLLVHSTTTVVFGTYVLVVLAIGILAKFDNTAK